MSTSVIIKKESCQYLGKYSGNASLANGDAAGFAETEGSVVSNAFAPQGKVAPPQSKVLAKTIVENFGSKYKKWNNALDGNCWTF